MPCLPYVLGRSCKSSTCIQPHALKNTPHQQQHMLLSAPRPCADLPRACAWWCSLAVVRTRRCRLHCTAQAGAGTPVAKNSILVVGGTGTLGRQVVRKALDEGYEVRCIVKPRMNPADFLRDWGATTVQVRGWLGLGLRGTHTAGRGWVPSRQNDLVCCCSELAHAQLSSKSDTG